MNKCLIYTFLLLSLILNGFTIVGQELKDITPAKKAQFDQYIELAQIAERGGDMNAQANNLSRAAFILWESNRLYDAIDVFQKAADLYKKLEDYFNLRNIYSNIGLLYSDLQDIDRAKEYFEEGLKLSRQLGQRERIASGLIDLAYLSSALGNFDESNSYLQEALDIALALNNLKLLLNIYGLMASNNKSLNNITQYTDCQDKYQIIYRSLQTQTERSAASQREVKTLATLKTTQEEVRKQDIELELRNLRIKVAQDNLERAATEALQRESQIKLLEQEKELQEAKIKEQELQQREAEAVFKHQEAVKERQQTVIYSGIIVLILAVIIVIALYRRYRDNKRSNMILEDQNAQIIEKSMELQEAVNKIEKQNTQIKQSINYAKGIQQAMIPPPKLLQAYLPESFVFWKPRDVVSGDFYWFRQVDDKFSLKQIYNYEEGIISTEEEEEDKLANANKLLLAAVDCTGHGVPGAFMSMIGNNLLDEITNKRISRPDIVLEQLHFGIVSALKQHTTGNKDGMDLALCLIDKKEKKLIYAGANSPLVYIKNGELIHLRGTSGTIGGVQSKLPEFELHEIALDSPTYFYMFSDGFVDQFGGPDGRKFMIKNFKDLLLEIHNMPFNEQENILRVTLDGWMGDSFQQIDDILIVGFSIDLSAN